MATDLILSPAPGLVPARLFAPTPKAAKRVLEFFTAQINNDHTRKAYLYVARRFAGWCEAHGLHELAHIQPVHVAAFVTELQGQFSPPTVKQHLAAHDEALRPALGSNFARRGGEDRDLRS